MDAFIMIFNANRHWILPLALTAVGGFLLREFRTFCLDSGLDVFCRRLWEGRKVEESFRGFSFPAWVLSPSMPQRRVWPGFQLVSALFFDDARYNSMK